MSFIHVLFFLNETGRRTARYINREGQDETAKYRKDLRRGLNYREIKSSRHLPPTRYQVLPSLIFASRSGGEVTLLLKILAFRSF